MLLTVRGQACPPSDVIGWIGATKSVNQETSDRGLPFEAEILIKKA